MEIESEGACRLIEKNKENPNFVIIDVRDPEEFGSGHVVGAINISLRSGDFEKKISSLDKDKAYLVYCLSGIRGSKAAAIMNKKGLRCSNVIGGISELESDGAEVSR